MAWRPVPEVVEELMSPFERILDFTEPGTDNFASKRKPWRGVNMDEKVAQQVFDELLPSLEALDTKCAALRQLLKDKGIASDDEFAPYLEQAANASSVRWRAARVRINHLLSTPKSAGAVERTPSAKSVEADANTSPQKDAPQGEQDSQGAQAASGADATTTTKQYQNERREKDRQSGEHAEKDAAGK
jgi:uncharacterized protein YcaQ